MLGRECLHPSIATVQEKASSEAFTEEKGQGLRKGRVDLWDGWGWGLGEPPAHWGTVGLNESPD